MFSGLRRTLSFPRACSTLRYASTPFRLRERCLSTSRILYESPRIVYLGNLPFRCEMEELKDRAEPFGPLIRITMPTDDRQRPAGFANIEFQEEISAQNFYEAVQNDGLVVNGRKASAILVATHQEKKMGLPESKTLHVTNFASQPTVAEVEEYFERFQESILEIRIGQGYTRSFAHVTFHTQEAATDALKTLQTEPIEVDGGALYVDYAASVSHSRPPRSPNNTLYFRGAASEDELREMLRPHTEYIQKIYFLPQEQGRQHRAGHIICHDVPAATDILNNYGDRMMLEYARPKRLDDRSHRDRQSRDRQPRDRQSRSPRKFESRASSGARNSYGGDWGGGRRNEGFYNNKE